MSKLLKYIHETTFQEFFINNNKIVGDDINLDENDINFFLNFLEISRSEIINCTKIISGKKIRLIGTVNNLYIRNLDKNFMLKPLCSNEKKIINDCLESNKILVISGQSGSGKTTLLNRIICNFDKNNKIFIFDEQSELFIPDNRPVVSINSLNDYHLSKKINPDFVVIGELNLVNEDKERTVFSDIQKSFIRTIFTSNYNFEDIKGVSILFMKNYKLDKFKL